jgi:thioesterase domain-containing protein
MPRVFALSACVLSIGALENCPVRGRVHSRPPHDRARSREGRRAILARVQDENPLCAELQATWHAEIPLAAAMAVEVSRFSEGELRVRAPLTPNRNLHGTAFAGSLFAVCVLTCWGKVWLAMRERDQHGRIVVSESRIDYHKAVTGEIVCRAPTGDGERAALDELASSGRATFMMSCTIDGADAPAVRFEGKYVVFAKRER